MRMYYLDMQRIYRNTRSVERAAIRKSMTTSKRDIFMEKKLSNQCNQCFYCATPIDMTSHLDHIVPVYYGGSNRSSNLVACCRPCNMYKATGQIEITNPATILDYQMLIAAKQKWDEVLLKKPYLKRYQPKRVRLYHVYRADLFRDIAVRTF